MAYRSGWNLKTPALVKNTAVALMLVPMGIWFFDEKVDLKQEIGIVLCLSGLVLLMR
jgi:uncharacterized membrane protein